MFCRRKEKSESAKIDGLSYIMHKGKFLFMETPTSFEYLSESLFSYIYQIWCNHQMSSIPQHDVYRGLIIKMSSDYVTTRVAELR